MRYFLIDTEQSLGQVVGEFAIGADQSYEFNEYLSVIRLSDNRLILQSRTDFGNSQAVIVNDKLQIIQKLIVKNFIQTAVYAGLDNNRNSSYALKIKNTPGITQISVK